MNNNTNEVKIINETYCAIYNQCESSLYDEEDCHYVFYQKVINAAYSLLKETAVNIEDEKDNFLSIKDISNIMKNIFDVIVDVDFIKYKENKLRKIFIKYKLNPDTYFIIKEFYD